MWRSQRLAGATSDHDGHRDKARRQNEPLAQGDIADVAGDQAVDEHLAHRHRTGDTGFAGNQVDADTVLGQQN
ncbi:Uncharacterised protein [Mycobacterium tuberculosis]|nr:Uncharacterised protein [Mycobacterium tuberculosis]